MSLIAIFLIVFLSGLVIFQTLLAFGAPFGKAAWGGQHDAVLPQKLRISSAISAGSLVYCHFVLNYRYNLFYRCGPRVYVWQEV